MTGLTRSRNLQPPPQQVYVFGPANCAVMSTVGDCQSDLWRPVSQQWAARSPCIGQFDDPEHPGIGCGKRGADRGGGGGEGGRDSEKYAGRDTERSGKKRQRLHSIYVPIYGVHRMFFGERQPATYAGVTCRSEGVKGLSEDTTIPSVCWYVGFFFSPGGPIGIAQVLFCTQILLYLFYPSVPRSIPA